MVNVADSVVVSSIPYRSANGTIKTADPVDDEDAATLKWVNRNAKVSEVTIADNTAAIKNELGDTLGSFSLKTVNGNSLFGSGDIAVSGGGDIQTAKYITVADTLGNLVQAFKDGDTSAYFTPLKQQCDIWLSSGNGNVNFVPKPCIISFTDSELLLSNYSSITYGSQYAHLYRFSGLLEGRVYYEVEIDILTSTAAAETASSNYEVADVYVSDYSFVDNNISIGNSSVDTSGTITQEQLNMLDNNDHKLIHFYGDYFRKNYRYASKLIYTCLAYNDTNETLIKFITINRNTREWQLTTKKVEGGGSGGGGGGGVEVIEKTANQDGTFTAPLTADEFNKLAANTAILKLTYMMYDFLPVIINLANPFSATVESDTTLTYTVGVLLAVNVVLLPTITSTDLTKIDLSVQIKDSTPITANGNDDKYDSISDYPLLGFVEDVADVPQLAIPKSFLIGSCLYSNGTWNWNSPSSNGIASDKYIKSWLTHINLYATDINATTLEAILLIKTESTLPGVEAYKRYSTIVHIGGTNTELGSEGLFTVYDTTTHKPIYITFEVVGDETNYLQIPNFKAYQDGADITTTYLTKVYGIEFYLL